MTEPTQQAQFKTHRIVHSDDVDLSVNSYGEPHKPTIIMIHGYPDSSEVWGPLVDILQHRFHVVTYDVRGCGHSSEPSWLWGYSLQNLSADLQAVMRAVCPTQPVHLLAHDWGSIQTWESVTDFKLKPRIASYTSISGPCLDHVGHWIRNGLGSGKIDSMGKVLKQVAHSWYIAAFQLPFLAPSAWRLGLDRAWPDLLKKLEGLEEHEASSTQRRDGVNGINLYRANMLPRLLSPRKRETTVPVQLLVPTEDKYVSTPLVESAYPFVNEVWRRDIDAGHWVVRTKADWVANCVSEFVEFAEQGRESPSLAKARVK